MNIASFDQYRQLDHSTSASFLAFQPPVFGFLPAFPAASATSNASNALCADLNADSTDSAYKVLPAESVGRTREAGRGQLHKAKSKYGTYLSRGTNVPNTNNKQLNN